MTDADAAQRPLKMPEKFLPYLEKYRVYRMFKHMLEDLILAMPDDHLKHMKMFITAHLHCTKDVDRVMMLVSPELDIDIKKLVKELIKSLGYFVITRRLIMDKYQDHDEYTPGCVSPELMSKVVKTLVTKEPVATTGWLMFDHPCTVREARFLQQDGVLPTVTLVLMPPPPVAPPAESIATPARSFFTQDFEGLKFAYKATLKEVHIENADDIHTITSQCFNAIRAAAGGLQGPNQGFQAIGSPGAYRVVLIGPLGSGRNTQARLLSRHFGLVYLNFDELYNIAKVRNDDIGEKLRKYGTSVECKTEIVRRRILEQDCIDQGWVLCGYPNSGVEFEHLDNMSTPPNRIIILNLDQSVCKKRVMNMGIDWCTGKKVPAGSGPRVVAHPGMTEEQIDEELETYFTEKIAEMRASAGITAVEIDASSDIDDVQVKLQAAVLMAPAYDIINCCQIRNARAE